jgi:signal transduction histidine kinase
MHNESFTVSSTDYSRQNLCRIQPSDNELDQFLRAVTHDMSASLRALSEIPKWVETDLAENGHHIPEYLREHLQMMRTAAMDLDTLLQGLSVVSRSFRIDSKPVALPIRKLLDTVQDSLVSGNTIILNATGANGTLLAPEGAAVTVFEAVVSNAICHNDQSSIVISVTCKCAADRIWIRMEDNGPGIPKEFRERVFEPLFMLKRREETGRSGLGLTIARKLVQRLGGTIRIEDTFDGRGTAVVFDLPAAD